MLTKKCKLFDEMTEGVEAMRNQRDGTVTLHTHEIGNLPAIEIDADLIRESRRHLHISRAVFARCLRVSARTLENWEQSRAKPNAQVAALILRVRKYPDTLKRLNSLDHQAA